MFGSADLRKNWVSVFNHLRHFLQSEYKVLLSFLAFLVVAGDSLTRTRQLFPKVNYNIKISMQLSAWDFRLRVRSDFNLAQDRIDENLLLPLTIRGHVTAVQKQFMLLCAYYPFC